MSETEADLHAFAVERESEIEALRQNALMPESSFSSFAREKGVAVSCFGPGAPGDLCKRGLLSADGESEEGLPLFHPFRMYVLSRILGALRTPSEDTLAASAKEWNTVIDLAVILEPVYWPKVSGYISYRRPYSEEALDAMRDEYRAEVIDLVRRFDQQQWKATHEDMRRYAAGLDENEELYLLLRVSKWGRRERLKGAIA